MRANRFRLFLSSGTPARHILQAVVEQQTRGVTWPWSAPSVIVGAGIWFCADTALVAGGAAGAHATNARVSRLTTTVLRPATGECSALGSTHAASTRLSPWQSPLPMLGAYSLPEVDVGFSGCILNGS